LTQATQPLVSPSEFDQELLRQLDAYPGRAQIVMHVRTGRDITERWEIGRPCIRGTGSAVLRERAKVISIAIERVERGKDKEEER
jgi:hypothetical protein